MLRVAAGVVVLAAALVLVLRVYVGLSLPEIEGSVELSGLSAGATIARDRHGIPVITAATRADLALATGYAHAQDRFFQMDLIRRQAAGELAGLVGEAAIDTDRQYRLHRFRDLAREVLKAASEPDRELLEQYARGVNAGLASLTAKPFEYLLLGADPEPWRAEDTVLVVYAMFVQLNDSRAQKDVRRGLARRVLPPGVFAWLYPQGTPWDAPMMGTAREVTRYPAADVYSVRDFYIDVQPVRERGGPPLDGSNNWAVSGALTDTGRAIVSNDMHLRHAVPNIFYQLRLVQTGGTPRDVAGVSLPGTPFVAAGSNRHIAWGYTNSYGDWSDAILLEPGAEPGTYRTERGDLPFREHVHRIEVKDGEPVEFRVRETIWGPVDDEAGYPDGDIAISWIAHSPRAVNLKIMALETAETVRDALDIANTMGMPPQNFVVGDEKGNIGWTIAGQIPVRGDIDPMVPVKGSQGAGWTGWRTPGEYPRIVNPPGGRIWTANARVADGAALDIIGDGGYDLGARARQIRDGLLARESFVPADMLAIQYDDRAVFLGRWRDLLLDVLDHGAIRDKEGLAEYRRLVEEWIPRASADSVGYRLVRGFRLEVKGLVFAGLIAPAAAAYDGPVEFLESRQFEAPLWQLVTERPEHLLPANFENWDALLLAAVQAHLGWLETRYGSPLAERAWGEYNTARIRHPLSQALPTMSGWLDMPADRLNGDSNLPKAQGPGFGASERFSVSPGDEENGLMHMPTGQSGHPLSPFYRAGHDSWVRGQPSPFLPGEPAFTLKLEPAGGTLSAD